FLTTLKQSLEEGEITEEDINTACRRILEAKFRLGLFDDPYRYMNAERAETDVFSQAHRNEARKIAAESFVLLKNEKVLPLKKKGTIAVIGPMGDNAENMPGTWSVATEHKSSVSLIQGLKEVAGDEVNILYAKGSNVVDDAAYETRFSIFGKDTKRDERSEADLTREALSVAKKADVIVVAMGEASEMSGESSSRSEIEFPAVQRRLLTKLLATGKPVVLVLFTGRPLALKWEHKNVPAILNVWFPGTEAGLAIADVIFGDVNPSGKLSTTFPQVTGQIPIFYNYKNTGRPLGEGKWFQKFRSNYLDVSNEPLYPFGYGLSYTEFKYGELNLSNKSIKEGEVLTASIDVMNVGNKTGKEVIQLYIRDLVGTVTRPVKELKGFQKISFEPGETKTIEFEVTTEDLKFYNYDLNHVWEPGEFEIMIGGNSRDVKSTKFEAVKNK
ncbi:MAG: glycoside hydrolase family 3 C-terminal domain-containing protein, partial [Bacteroidota bacterium]